MHWEVTAQKLFFYSFFAFRVRKLQNLEITNILANKSIFKTKNLLLLFL